MTDPIMPFTLFKNARLIDGLEDKPSAPMNVLVEEGRIKAISETAIPTDQACVYDLKGKFLMPGLIDCHAHPFLAEANPSRLNEIPPTLMTARAVNILHNMLNRGFTTIRDAAGGDWGIKQALEEGEIQGPRMYIAGRALSQTGGHGDMRRRTEEIAPCSCADALAYMSQTVDGVDDIRKAVREQFRKGADQIKIMVSGGVSSQHDPLDRDQYSFEEICAVVEEAERRGSYVMAHAYGASAIKTALNAGVRTIEHGNLIDSEAASIAAKRSAFVVPTLVTYSVLERQGLESGWSTGMLDKLRRVKDVGLESIEICKREGTKLGFGTDLIGDTFDYQSEEFNIRSEVESPREIINSCTRVNAEIVQQSGHLGEVSVGAIADLLVVAKNPLEDINVLTDTENLELL